MSKHVPKQTINLFDFFARVKIEANVWLGRGCRALDKTMKIGYVSWKLFPMHIFKLDFFWNKII